MNVRRVTKAVAVAMTIGMVAGARAETASASVPMDTVGGWKLELTPYAWLAGMEGDVTVKGQNAEFDKSFSDLFDAVDMAGSLLAIAQYDRYLVWGQVDYISSSTDELDEEDQPQGGSLDSEMLLGEAAVGYQFDGWMEGQTFDVLVGARALHLEHDLEVNGVGTLSDSRDLLDPMLVLRPSVPIFPSKIKGLRFNPTMAIGGGGDSKLVYELQPQLQYQISQTMAARAGYRRVGYEIEGDKDGNELNVALAGLIVGLGVTF
jgi:hypothetical protein